MAGFRAGARKAYPGVRLLAGFSNAVTRPGRCANLAHAQIAAGSVVIFPVAGGCSEGAFAEAAREGVWSIGSAVAPAVTGDAVLASATDNVEHAVTLMLEALEGGRFAAGSDVEVGIAQNAVGLSDLSPSLSPLIRRRIAAVYDERLRGHVDPQAFGPGCESGYGLYTVALDRRDEVQARLRDDGVPTAIYYPQPLHRMKAFAAYAPDGGLPATERLAERVLSLPMHPYLTDEQARYVADRVVAALAG